MLRRSMARCAGSVSDASAGCWLGESCRQPQRRLPEQTQAPVSVVVAGQRDDVPEFVLRHQR